MFIGATSKVVNAKVPSASRALVLIAASLALAVLAAVALSFNLSRLRESFAWVQHPNETLREISAVERALLEAESTERGYLLAGEESYLANYNRFRVEIPRLLVALRGLIRTILLKPRISTNCAQMSRRGWMSLSRPLNWGQRA